MKILSFSLMMSVTLTLLTVGIVTSIPAQPAEAEKAYCGPNVGKCPAKKSDCEAIAGKGECEKVKFDIPE